MRALLDFTRREDVRSFASAVSEDLAVQGIVVDYDPLWLALWEERCVHGDEAVRSRIELLIRAFHYFGFQPGPASLTPHPAAHRAELSAPLDIKWRPPHWEELLACLGDRSRKGDDGPIVVKVCLLPTREQRGGVDVFESSFRVIREYRSPAVLSASSVRRPLVGGISIGAGPDRSGTLGGIVKDQGGKLWGMTCAHVVGSAQAVDQPAATDGGMPPSVGFGSLVSTLRPAVAQSPCNPYSRNAVLNTVDATLIDVTDPQSARLEIAQFGPLRGVVAKDSLEPGTLVDFAGKQSGARILEVGGLALTYKLHDAITSDVYCFTELFEVRWPRLGQTMLHRPVQRGDSGAWVLASGPSGLEWAGMVIAGDRLIGYAVFAENIIDWAAAQHGLQLGVC